MVRALCAQLLARCHGREELFAEDHRVLASTKLAFPIVCHALVRIVLKQGLKGVIIDHLLIVFLLLLSCIVSFVM